MWWLLHVPSVSAIIITPSLYRIASTLVPVTMGWLHTSIEQAEENSVCYQ